MLNIYICEDDKAQLQRLAEMIQTAIFIEDYDMKIQIATTDGQAILSHIEHSKGMGIYFLDVDLGNLNVFNGIQLAEQIRKYDPRGYIIFITTHSELSYLTFTYKVEALDYISKDDFALMNERIKHCINNIVQKHSSNGAQSSKHFNILTKDKTLHVDYNSIIFFETAPAPHKIIVHCDHRTLEFYGNISAIEDNLSLDTRFIRSHQSYLINRDKILEVDRKLKLIRFINGQTCNVSSKGLKMLQQIR